jgi:hypothetical protein
MIDLARYYHHWLTVGGRNSAGDTIPPIGHYPGRVTIKSSVPSGDRIDTACSMAYDYSVYHEIVTWFIHLPGSHNSSFSPEDLVSNFLGAYVGGRTIAAGGAFDAAATKELASLLSLLDPRPPADTRAAFAAITNRWIDPTPGAIDLGPYANAGKNDRYVLRRNFDFNPINPWFAPGVTFCASTTWPATVPKSFDPRITGYYEVEFDLPPQAAAVGSKVKNTDFATAIATIKTDAKTQYGPDYATP